MTPRPRSKAAPRRPPPPAAPPGLSPGAVLIPLAVLALLRGLLTVVPGMWAWGLDLQRFLDPVLAWALWAVMVAALVPRVGELLVRGASRLGAPLSGHPAWTALCASLALAALVLLLPDRGWFLGDFQLRERAIEGGLYQAVLPQSLPLDALLHYHLPRWLEQHFGWSLTLYARGLGAIGAALLAALGLGFARQVNHDPGVAPWLALTVAVGGPLVVCTGFPKSTAELCVLTLALAVLGVRLVRTGRGHLAFGIVLALALLDHRSALAFLPAAAFAGWECLRRRHGLRPVALAALPPLAVLVAMAPRVARILREYDLPMHIRHGDAPAATGAAALLEGGLRALDLANAILILAPVAVLLPLLLLRARRQLGRADALYVLILASAFVPVALLVQPRQGWFRDWEMLAPAALAASLLVAWTLGGAIKAGRAAPGLAVAVACSTLAPALGLLAHAASPPAALLRARAFVAGPPVRTVVERTFLWDYIGERSLALGRSGDAAAAFAQVASVEPTRGVLLSWGLAAAGAGDFAATRRAFTRLLAQQPNDPAAWLGLGGAAAGLGDSATVARARERLERYAEDGEVREVLRRMLRENPALWPAYADSLER